MFEGSQEFYQAGLRSRLRQQSRDAREKAAIDDAAIGLLGDAFIKKRDENDELRARIAELKKANDDLWTRAAIAEADAAGRKAQFDALKTEHPDSPLFRNSDRTFRDGTMKTRIRLLYEAAFDVAARRWRISDPASHRKD